MPDRFHRTVVVAAYSLSAALLLALSGCTGREGVPDRDQPALVSERTWQRVDRDIGAASLTANGPAENFARGSMEAWRSRVHQRSEEDFIPWYTSYWTQQWLSIKVAWYKLGDGEGDNAAVKRLAAYLQEQYHERVLAPVAEEIDPETIRRQTTALYVRLLAEQIPGIQLRYGVPVKQFERRLKAIRAIVLAPPPAPSTSLYELVHARPLDSLAAYAALLARIKQAGSGVGAGPSDATISPVAQQSAEKLLARLAVSGGASAAAAALGGVAGMVISLGATGIGAIAHAKERPELEAQLRQTLDAALDEMWHSLLEDPSSGVLAGVHHISGEIAGSLAKTATPVIVFELKPRNTPPLDEEPPLDEPYDDAPADDGDADE